MFSADVEYTLLSKGDLFVGRRWMTQAVLRILRCRPFVEVVSSGVARKRRPCTVSLFLVAFHQSKFRAIDGFVCSLKDLIRWEPRVNKLLLCLPAVAGDRNGQGRNIAAIADQPIDTISRLWGREHSWVKDITHSDRGRPKRTRRHAATSNGINGNLNQNQGHIF